MQQADFYDLFVSRFNSLGLEYMVTGSVASIFYGEPRLTHGIDLVLHLKKARSADFSAAFPANEFYCPPTETIGTETTRERGGGTST